MDRVWDEDFEMGQSELSNHKPIRQSESSVEVCSKSPIEEPVSITQFILNDFEDGIIFTFNEIENIEINILFSNTLPVNKITGNVELKEKNGQTNRISLTEGAVRTLAVFDLTEREKRMVKSGLVLRMGTTCK